MPELLYATLPAMRDAVATRIIRKRPLILALSVDLRGFAGQPLSPLEASELAQDTSTIVTGSATTYRDTGTRRGTTYTYTYTVTATNAIGDGAASNSLTIVAR